MIEKSLRRATRGLLVVGFLVLCQLGVAQDGVSSMPQRGTLVDRYQPERQLTTDNSGHILTNIHVWSRDSRWIVYDTRSDPAGSVFDGSFIRRVRIGDGMIETIYEAAPGSHCGVATFSPTKDQVAFIQGPEPESNDWPYSAFHRRGVVVDLENGRQTNAIDAMNYSPPFVPGALRGGSHVHVFSPDGHQISFTYEDHVLANLPTVANDSDANMQHQLNQRNVGVSVLGRSVQVLSDHPRSHSGQAFSVLVTETTNRPRPGSDEILKAYEDAWIGNDGYVRSDGQRQKHALAFLGDCIDEQSQPRTELFVVDLPPDLTRPGSSPIEGTETRRPSPPQGVVQRRLTRTSGRKFPGIRGPRHWPRSHPDGSVIATLMLDDDQVAQIHLVDANTGEHRPLTQLSTPVASSFTWSPNGRWIAIVTDGSVVQVDVDNGDVYRLTKKEAGTPRPEACVFSPDGRHIAFVRQVNMPDGSSRNQIFVVESIE